VANNYRFKDAHNRPVIFFWVFLQNFTGPTYQTMSLSTFISLASGPHMSPLTSPHPQSPHGDTRAASPLARSDRFGRRPIWSFSAAARSRSGHHPIWPLWPPPHLAAPATSASGRSAAARSRSGHSRSSSRLICPLPICSVLPRAHMRRPAPSLPLPFPWPAWPKVAASGPGRRWPRRAWPELAIVVNATVEKKRNR
jgi:hypothetical protein